MKLQNMDLKRLSARKRKTNVDFYDFFLGVCSSTVLLCLWQNAALYFSK